MRSAFADSFSLATFILESRAGKSVLIQKYLFSLPGDGYVPPNVIGFSARTTANMTQYLIDAKLDRRRKVGSSSGTLHKGSSDDGTTHLFSKWLRHSMKLRIY